MISIGTASGTSIRKATIVNRIINQFLPERVALISPGSYYEDNIPHYGMSYEREKI